MLVAGRPASLVLDELRGELFGRFHSVQQTALDHASEQMAFTLEIASVNVLDAGFRIRFTRPLGNDRLDVGNARISQYDYDYWWEYGSPERDTQRLKVTGIK